MKLNLSIDLKLKSTKFLNSNPSNRSTLFRHKCCNMTVWELPRKSLYCVRNLRINELKCSSDNSDSYQIKIRTLGGCNKFTCE